MIPGWENSLEKEATTQSSILAWRIPWTEEPCRLQSMGAEKQTGWPETTEFKLSQF